jgi:UDP-2-acetamido-3-amino-2,3-dideoxy-glucuronate N-acetyltransferase
VSDAAGTNEKKGYFAHESAYVDEPATIGDGTKIWHFCHVMSGATLGRGVNLGQNVFIAAGVTVGDNVKIQNNVSLYAGVIVEDDVFCGPSCVFTNVINPRSEIVRHGSYMVTRVRRGATIGANATIVCGSTIGRYAFVAAGSVITKSEVPDYALMAGVPAVRKGWMSRHGHKLPPFDTAGIATCPESGYRYRETPEGTLRCLDIDEDEARRG